MYKKNIGIIAASHVGRNAIRLLQQFDVNVLLYDPYCTAAKAKKLGATKVTLSQLLKKSDVVSINAPKTDETYHMMGAKQFRMMKDDAILINTARGPVVNTAALVRALREGWIAAAALDVTDPEPLLPDHPLLTLPNCIVVPHIASATVTAREQMAVMAAENLLAGLRGERLPYCVNLEVYE